MSKLLCYFFWVFFPFLTLCKNCRWQAIFYPRSHPLKHNFCWNKGEEAHSISLSPCPVNVLAAYIWMQLWGEYIPSAGVCRTISAVGNDLPMGFTNYRYWEAVGCIYVLCMCHMPVLINVDDLPCAASSYSCAFIKLSYSWSPHHPAYCRNVCVTLYKKLGGETHRK